MVTLPDIAWGKYLNYSGPWYRGSQPFELKGNTEEERIVAVITATEGGCYDAYNGYDKCIATGGLIQLCEAGMYNLSGLLGHIATFDRTLLVPLLKRCDECDYEFKKNDKGRWRFFSKNDLQGEVDTIPEQQRLFLLNADGKQDTWDDASRDYAKRWALAIVNTLGIPASHKFQLQYTASRLFRYMTPYALGVFDSNLDTGKSPRWRALRAAYLSFAANNPARAERDLEAALRVTGPQWDSPDGAREILSALTFNSGVTIYPGRYNKIRPVLERLYGVDIPDIASDLRVLKRHWPAETVQAALLLLGYDLGPRCVDGKWGEKSSTALLAFRQACGVGPLNVNTPMPTDYVALEDTLERRGLIDSLRLQYPSVFP